MMSTMFVCADGHLAALKYLLDGKPSDDFNLGTGEGSTVKEAGHYRPITTSTIQTMQTITNDSGCLHHAGGMLVSCWWYACIMLVVSM